MMTVKASDADPAAGAGRAQRMTGRALPGRICGSGYRGCREQLIALGEQVVSDLEGSAWPVAGDATSRDAEGDVFELKERRTG